MLLEWYGGRFQCPLWVKSRHRDISNQCPLYPQKRTFDGHSITHLVAASRGPPSLWGKAAGRRGERLTLAPAVCGYLFMPPRHSQTWPGAAG